MEWEQKSWNNVGKTHGKTWNIYVLATPLRS
jgi:hypothetical protein